MAPTTRTVLVLLSVAVLFLVAGFPLLADAQAAAVPAAADQAVVGVCLPLFARSVPALRPDRNLFVVVKAFASGVILATGYMHVLEMGIVVHSVVIGLGMGASQNACTIRPLVAAMCFHQMFEGMGLGGCILQAEYGARMRSALVFFFSTTTPFGIALGLALTRVYRDDSPTALVVVGLLNAASAGLLHYMALVELLAADFMGPRLQGNVRLQLAAFLAVLLGAGGMSVMAKWA
uniref:Fe(2+) transport protein 1 n=1 Tax=Oryza brachyantha TaxID=4533 RepID=J3LRE9_ORYBR